MDTTDIDALLNAGIPFWCRRTGSIEEHRESSMKKERKIIFLSLMFTAVICYEQALLQRKQRTDRENKCIPEVADCN